MKHGLINMDCMEWLPDMEEIDTIFADPPDNIGLGYDTYKDKHSEEEYVGLLQRWLCMFVAKAKTIWLSYNAKWTFEIGRIVCALQESHGKTLTVKPCVQTYTFGQHNHHDLGNNHRPLIRFQRAGAPLYPDAIRVPSWRQENGDKRADPRGRRAGRRVRLHPCHRQQQATPGMAPDPIERGAGGALPEIDHTAQGQRRRSFRRHRHDAPRLQATGPELHPL